ncbi:hypothetical protein Tfer_2167 [Thermincola ferriacetica]|uniref:Uncharacterized protein n=1 Tax=Thermincola ferriacetica TaxID=281456 RepID=A0A0L6W173_9FIRM|nr:hypothetical protein Tfer_2167 [Thermincola ferriacetica]
MNAGKSILIKLIDEIPESQIPEVIDFNHVFEKQAG